MIETVPTSVPAATIEPAAVKPSQKIDFLTYASAGLGMDCCVVLTGCDISIEDMRTIRIPRDILLSS
jgi:hypothetical protein